jgi:hypothetical protein
VKTAPLLVALVVLLALLESALGLYGPRAVATDADWEAAARLVRAELKPGDLIVFSPSWVDQVGRQHLGDVMPVAMVARADAAAYGRIWELSIRGAAAEETRGLSPVQEVQLGHVRLRRFEQRAASIRYDFTAQHADASVSTHPSTRPDEVHACIVDGAAHRCGTTQLEPRVMEIDYRPRRGLLAPIVPGETTDLVYEAVPGGTLVGYVGLHDYYARKSADGVVLLRAQVDGHSAVTVPVRNEDGWKRFELPLEGEGKHRVQFSLSSDRPAWRLPGFHAEVRAP